MYNNNVSHFLLGDEQHAGGGWERDGSKIKVLYEQIGE